MAAFGLDTGQASIILTAVTGAIWVLMVFLIRVFLRSRVNGPFGRDDWACGASTLAAVLYSLLVVVQVGLGFAAQDKQITPQRQNTILIVGWVAQFPFVLASGMSKVSACYLVARMTETKEHLAVAYAVLSAVIMWIIAGCVLVVVQCEMPHPWVLDPVNVCINRYAQWMSMAIMSYILELAILLAAIYMVWSIQMKVETKIKVILAFSSRLLLVPPGVSRLIALDAQRQSATPGDYTVQVANLTLITMHTLVIATTIPCAKPFFSVFSSGVLSRHTASTRNSVIPVARRPQLGSGGAIAIHRDRAGSTLDLRLKPTRGVNESHVQHVAPPPSSSTPKTKKPSIAISSSSRDILYSHEFNVSHTSPSLRDNAGLLDRAVPNHSGHMVPSSSPGTPSVPVTPNTPPESPTIAAARAEGLQRISGHFSRRLSRKSARSSQAGSSPTVKSVEEAGVGEWGIDRRVSP